MLNKTKIFLDSGDVAETKIACTLPFSIEGQTTNPSLLVKNNAVKKQLERGEIFSTAELYRLYQSVVQEIDTLLPGAAISIEVYADESTSAEEMYAEADRFSKWVENAYIKLPITAEGLRAARLCVDAGHNINMTLCFSIAQAAAVYEATIGAPVGSVYISPFIGRLDGIGTDGLSLIRGIQDLYKDGDGHVSILAASIRDAHHLYELLNITVDILTAPLAVLQAYATNKDVLTEREDRGLNSIDGNSIVLGGPIDAYDITHPLTTAGLEQFVSDWNSALTLPT